MKRFWDFFWGGGGGGEERVIFISLFTCSFIHQLITDYKKFKGHLNVNHSNENSSIDILQNS